MMGPPAADSGYSPRVFCRLADEFYRTGITDNPVTLQAAVALGAGVPLFLLPSMHDSMAANPILKGHVTRLRDLGVHFLTARVEEDEVRRQPVRDG